MPELPEVEVTRLSFSERIEGARVTGVRIGKPLRWPLGVAPDELLGQTVGRVARRGKYLWLPLERGGLLLHLGMSDRSPSPRACRRTARTTTST
jgi:formamidopyrimidine-DNA glycosylase